MNHPALFRRGLIVLGVLTALTVSVSVVWGVRVERGNDNPLLGFLGAAGLAISLCFLELMVHERTIRIGTQQVLTDLEGVYSQVESESLEIQRFLATMEKQYSGLMGYATSSMATIEYQNSHLQLQLDKICDICKRLQKNLDWIGGMDNPGNRRRVWLLRRQ